MSDKVIEMKPVEEKAYTLRKLCAKDVFPMVRLISKIGVNKFAKCFAAESMQDLVMKFVEDDAEEAADGTEDSVKKKVQISTITGITVGLEIAEVLFESIGVVEQDLYVFLANISNLSKEQVKELDMGTFFQMIMDFVQKEEFKDFFKVVSGLLAKGN